MKKMWRECPPLGDVLCGPVRDLVARNICACIMVSDVYTPLWTYRYEWPWSWFETWSIVWMRSWAVVTAKTYSTVCIILNVPVMTERHPLYQQTWLLLIRDSFSKSTQWCGGRLLIVIIYTEENHIANPPRTQLQKVGWVKFEWQKFESRSLNGLDGVNKSN